jgi:adenylate cyclase
MGKMTENTKFHPVAIDLNQFKLHIELRDKIELTLHFNSPSRRFYLSVIALVVNEMKRQGKLTSISMERHHALLALLNDTVGGSAGSSDKENLLVRIYKKWKDALPNLEEAPLFKVLGRKKEYDEGAAKSYPFTDSEKDSWANLFEYKGSEENVRLKFAIDRIGATLDDIVIIYEDCLNGDAWERFISGLKEKEGEKQEAEPDQRVSEESKVVTPPMERKKTLLSGRYRWVALAAIVIVLGTTSFVMWKNSSKPNPNDIASVEKMAFPLPDKPSIAVLPFVNMSGDPKQEFLCDGMTEAIITGLTRVPKLFVISRTSTSAYKGKLVKVKQVSEELGVRYVLEGSVQRFGNRVRITAQLIDALKGHHLFSERYDLELKDLFTTQDDVTMKIVTAMRVQLTEGEWARAYSKGTKNLEAYLKVVQSYEKRQLFTRESQAQARQLAEEAIALDPSYAMAYCHWVLAIANELMMGVYKNHEEILARAMEMAQKTVAMDESLAAAHMALGIMYMMSKKDYDRGVAEGERAVALEPNSADVVAQLAIFLHLAGRPEEAIPIFKKAIRLSPIPQPRWLFNMAGCYRMMGQYQEAISICKQIILKQPDQLYPHVQLAASYMAIGREAEARAEAAEILRIDPKFSLEHFANTMPRKNQSEMGRMVELLRKAGLK